jgi:hypothetical protein
MSDMRATVLIHPAALVAGDFHGADNFVEALRRLREQSAGTIELAPLAVPAGAERFWGTTAQPATAASGDRR